MIFGFSTSTILIAFSFVHEIAKSVVIINKTDSNILVLIGLVNIITFKNTQFDALPSST